MFLISNDPNVDFDLITSRFKLERVAAGKFQILFQSRLGRWWRDSQGSFYFVYGSYHPNFLAVADELFEGCYTFFKINTSNDVVEFYSDPFNLGSFSYLNTEALNVFDDVVLLKYLSVEEINREAVQSYVTDGCFPPGATVFKNCSMSQIGHKYSWSKASRVQIELFDIPLKMELQSHTAIPKMFYEIVKANCSFLVEQFQIKKFLLSGGSDSRLVLASLLDLKTEGVTAVLQKTWNPNSAADCEIAEEICRFFGFPFELENTVENFDARLPSLQNFLASQASEPYCLTGFHGTEFLAAGPLCHFDEKRTGIQNRFCMSESFMSSIYEGIPGTLFHFPRLLTSRGFFTPYRDSYLLKFLNSIPSSYLKDYRLQIETFKTILPELGAFAFHSSIVRFDKELKKASHEPLPPPRFDSSHFEDKIKLTLQSFGINVRIEILSYEEKMRWLNIHFLINALTVQPKSQGRSQF